MSGKMRGLILAERGRHSPALPVQRNSRDGSRVGRSTANRSSQVGTELVPMNRDPRSPRLVPPMPKVPFP